MPAWLIFLVMVIVTIGSIEIGVVIGRRYHSTDDNAGDTIGAVVGATLGLLAFMVAFIFGFVHERYGERRSELLDEVNAISRVYNRAGLIPDSVRDEARGLLREYVDLRVSLTRSEATVEDIPVAVARSLQIQRKLWASAEYINHVDRSSEAFSLYTDSLNDMFGAQRRRLYVVYHHIPLMVWLVTFLIACVSMVAVGYQSCRTDKRRHILSAILALTFGMVIVLIAELDSTKGTLIKVNQTPLFDLQRTMQPVQTP
jgi:hypothetical protein